MDNRMIDITSEGREGLSLALKLIWTNAVGGKATHFKVIKVEESTNYYGRHSAAQDPMKFGTMQSKAVPDNCDGLPGINVRHYSRVSESPDGVETLIILWHDERNAIVLPFPLTLDGAVEFVSGWLASRDYGQQQDHDGSNGRGWRMFTDHWGHVVDHHYAIVGVQPAWAMYGK